MAKKIIEKRYSGWLPWIINATYIDSTRRKTPIVAVLNNICIVISKDLDMRQAIREYHDKEDLLKEINCARQMENLSR